MHFLWGKHKQRAKSHLHATVIHAESKWKTKIECRRYRYSVFQINSVFLQVYSGVTLNVPHFPYKSFPSQCAYKRPSTICPRKTRSFKYLQIWFFKRFIAKKVCTACSSTNNNIVLLTNFNKCEIKVNINNSGKKSLKNACRWANYCRMCFTRLCLYFLYTAVRSAKYKSRFVWPGG